MVTLYLDKIFNPKSIAVIGASDEEGTVKGILNLKEEETKSQSTE